MSRELTKFRSTPSCQRDVFAVRFGIARSLTACLVQLSYRQSTVPNHRILVGVRTASVLRYSPCFSASRSNRVTPYAAGSAGFVSLWVVGTTVFTCVIPYTHTSRIYHPSVNCNTATDLNVAAPVVAHELVGSRDAKGAAGCATNNHE